MKEELKKIVPASNEQLDRVSQSVLENQNAVMISIKKELKRMADTNIRMNENTNIHIEEVKKQLSNSLDSKAEYIKKRMGGFEQKYQALEIKELQIQQKLERIERLLEMSSYGVTQEKRKRQIIVTFTSYGKRIYTVPLVLERLINQTVRPDRIILYLSEENFPGKEKDLPERLLEMRQFGIEIRWCEGDIRSYKKIIPALEEFPEDILITIDDDIYYDLDLIEKLYDSYKRFPEAISALRVHKMEFDEENQLLPYNEWKNQYSEILNEPSMWLFPTTGGGTLFPPHSLSEEVMNKEKFMELCPNADDVWIKFMAVLNNTPVVLAAPCKKLEYIAETQEDSLWKLNVTENDGQIAKLLEVYNTYPADGETLLERITKFTMDE